MPSRQKTEYVRPSGSGSTIAVDASPGARSTEIVGPNPWRGALQIKIAAEPKDGAANEALLAFLAQRLGIRKSEVRLVKGERSSSKLIFVPVSPEKVKKLLGDD